MNPRSASRATKNRAQSLLINMEAAAISRFKQNNYN
jgi:hypothetical protein